MTRSGLRYVRLVPERGGVVGVGVPTARIRVRGSGYTWVIGHNVLVAVRSRASAWAVSLG